MSDHWKACSSRSGSSLHTRYTWLWTRVTRAWGCDREQGCWLHRLLIFSISHQCPRFPASVSLFSFLFFFLMLFIYLASSGLVAHGPFHCGLQAQWLPSAGSRVCRLSSCGTRAELLHSMWDLSSLTRDWTSVPCIASRFLTTGPPGKSLVSFLLERILPNPSRPRLCLTAISSLPCSQMSLISKRREITPSSEFTSIFSVAQMVKNPPVM